MTYSVSNNCTNNYYNRTLTVQVIVEDVVTWILLRHCVPYISPLTYVHISPQPTFSVLQNDIHVHVMTNILLIVQFRTF